MMPVAALSPSISPRSLSTPGPQANSVGTRGASAANNPAASRMLLATVPVQNTSAPLGDEVRTKAAFTARAMRDADAALTSKLVAEAPMGAYGIWRGYVSQVPIATVYR